MPKWVRRAGVIAAAVATGSVAWTSGAQAATPTISLGSAHTAVTLPSGCRANDFQVTNSPDGSYHGYLQATCDKEGKFFYISRSPSGTWALRTTNIDIQIPLATTTDNTGTYFVGVRSNHDLILVRRNGNGSLSKVHVLQKYSGYDLSGFNAASVIASNGNYWATWDYYSTGPHDYIDYNLEQARTMAPAESTRTVGQPQWFGPELVARSGKAPQLVGCEMSTDYLPDATYSVITANATTDDWALSQQFTNDSCGEGGSGNTAAGYFGGHTYFAMPESGGIYDDRSGTFKLTPLTGMTGSRAVLNLTSTRVAFIGNTSSGETEWLQNSDGTFSATPTGVLSAAPVPVLTDQIINRSGKVIRLFVQHDTVHHLAGTRLLEQIQK